MQELDLAHLAWDLPLWRQRIQGSGALVGSARLRRHVAVQGLWRDRPLLREHRPVDVAGVLRWLHVDARLVALARDCAQMRAMFIAAPPEFEVVMACLAEAERMLNGPAAS